RMRVQAKTTLDDESRFSFGLAFFVFPPACIIKHLGIIIGDFLERMWNNSTYMDCLLEKRAISY
ncbi:hypothetical protein, partial [uncultured Parabacteroides sp.]|uniref:hypothetical protein n=1 Tax=uncultured Parabacteroides sp. TaxID=512312 RepID=UPI0028050A61